MDNKNNIQSNFQKVMIVAIIIVACIVIIGVVAMFIVNNPDKIEKSLIEIANEYGLKDVSVDLEKNKTYYSANVHCSNLRKMQFSDVVKMNEEMSDICVVTFKSKLNGEIQSFNVYNPDSKGYYIEATTGESMYDGTITKFYDDWKSSGTMSKKKYWDQYRNPDTMGDNDITKQKCNICGDKSTREVKNNEFMCEYHYEKYLANALD